MTLLLEAVDVREPLRWRWLLREGDTGTPLADHQVDLDPAAAEVTALRDLYGYARSYAAPDRRVADEARIVNQLGSWAGQVLLGERIGAAIVAAAPVTVRVAVPPEASFVLLWPLELAHVDGMPLAARGEVSLVYDVASIPDSPRPSKAEPGEALRMLAVFSLPTQTSVLALRRERYTLSRLIRRIAAKQRRMVELRVVQYGVTRERLAEIADTGDGWDVLHLSGHGGPGLFLLEHPDGRPDPVDVTDLTGLLRPIRRRVKLAVVSACQSAAATTAETLRLIGLTDQAEQIEEGDVGPGEPDQASAGVARALVAELDCPVVAMRYPVSDEFAIAFAGEFYERLLGRGQSADVAAARAARDAARPVPSAARPAISLATPGVFGARAAGLLMTVPRGEPRFDPDETPTAYFPPEPTRFVGRAAAMAAASTALAPASGQTAVLLHGMAGAGKTACALELAYRHQDAFAAAAFWQAPTDDDAFAGALGSLAGALEIQLGRYGFTMTGHIGTVAALEAYLPRLRQVLANTGLLLVLDNLETLLTPEGTWRDPRWEPLFAALTGHSGESRLILTSRIPPTRLGRGVLVQPVHALSLHEAVALARELPNLRNLLHADPGPVRAPDPADADQDRDRVRRVLRVVQGHPKLLELADAAATDRARLDRQLAAAEATAGPALEAFFRDGASTLDPDQFLAALTAWTTTALTVLPPPVRLMAEFLACLEDADRQADIIEATWPRLDLPGDPEPLLATLTAAALIQPDYTMHPGVAAAIAAAAPSDIPDAVDIGLGAFWYAVASQAREKEDSALVVRAGLAAVPYLLRRRDWSAASTLLNHVVLRDYSPLVSQAVLPALRHIAAATGTLANQWVLARALRTADPAEAEPLLRDALSRAVDDGDYQHTVALAAELVNLLFDTGRLAEALPLAERQAGYSRKAGLGPWSQLHNQGMRLTILSQMGQHELVLAETAALRAQMLKLPERVVGNDPAAPWRVREAVLNTGAFSAQALERWEQCLDLNAEIQASQRQRGATLYEINQARSNDAGPLIELGQLTEAGRLLRECQRVFEDHHDLTGLVRVMGTRANLENRLGHPDIAADLMRTVIRLCYTRPEPRDIAISHKNLASLLGAAGADPGGQRAHRLAAALVFWLTGMAHDLADAQRGLTVEMRASTGTGPLPSTLDEVIRVAEQTDGVRLGELIASLAPSTEAAEEALAEILRDATSHE